MVRDISGLDAAHLDYADCFLILIVPSGRQISEVVPTCGAQSFYYADYLAEDTSSHFAE